MQEIETVAARWEIRPEDMRCAGAAVCRPIEEGMDLLRIREVISASWGFTVATALISFPAAPEDNRC